MGKAKKPKHAKLIIGMLAKDEKLFEKSEEFFTKKFGRKDYESVTLSFEHTSYYENEMGRGLKRKFVSFDRLLPQDRLPQIKIFTNKLESISGKKEENRLRRLINIDPGFMTDSKLILATTKDYYHRTYLGKGIYAEVTLAWQKGSFRTFEWTYPDYRTPEYMEILKDIRNIYMKQDKTG